jgi:hypothetical protein
MVRRLRALRGVGESVPWFDPAGPGVAATVLILLEAPGAMATAASASGRRRSGSGIISPDNDDRTAAEFSRMRDEAGLSYADCLHWNVVPWYIGTTTAIRNPTMSDIDEALPHLRDLLKILTRLLVVVPMGRKAQAALSRLQPSELGAVAVVPTLHPSPLVINRDPANRGQIVEDLRRAHEIVQRGAYHG